VPLELQLLCKQRWSQRESKDAPRVKLPAKVDKDLKEKGATAAAVRIRWPADEDFKEKEAFQWSVLTKDNWNAEAVLGWRFSPAELKKRSAEATAAKRSRH